MTSRYQTKKALINEFMDPASLALIGGLAAGAYGMYRGIKKGTGARWRTWQNIKHGASIGGAEVLSKIAADEHLKETDKWHREIVGRYGPTYTYDKYKQHLAQHDAMTSMAPDRDQLVSDFNTAHQTRHRVAANLQAGMDRFRHVTRSGLDPTKELFDPSRPHLGTVEKFLADNEPKDINIHGHKIAPPPAVPPPGYKREQSLHDFLQGMHQDYRDPLGLTHKKSASANYTIADVASMTDIEKMDSANPDAAAYRREVTQKIIEPRHRQIQALNANSAQNAQAIAQHRSLMDADRQRQELDLAQSRAALKPWLLTPNIGMGERLKRLAVKSVRNKLIDTLRVKI